MKRPTKKQIDHLRLAIGMTGVCAINNHVAELILVVQAEMERLGDSYSLKDAAKITAQLEKRWKSSNPKS